MEATRGRVVVALAAVLLGATGCSAHGDEVDALGAHVVETGSAPTGYEVVFRVDAGDVPSVRLVGDLFFTDPAHISALAHDERTGLEWRAGDVPQTLYLGAPPALERGPDGIWEYRTPLPAGSYNYGYVYWDCSSAVTCTSSYDPANPPVLAGDSTATAQDLSQVVVPEHPDFPTYDADFVQPRASADERGTVSSLTYAGSGGDQRSLAVYLPPGYDPQREQPYPTLYLQHGMYDNETSWMSKGQAPAIVDNAIAEGAVEPIVVVTTSYYGLVDGDEGNADLPGAYMAELEGGLIPFVEATFHVSRDPSERAFGGLSFGGHLGLEVLRDRPGLFGAYGVWSAADDLEQGSVTPLTAEQVERASAVRAVHMGTGLEDNIGTIAQLSQARAEQFAAAGLPVTEYVTHGAHTWPVWQQLLNDYLRTVAFEPR